MKTIDGKKIAKRILDKVQLETSQLPFRPLFCDVMVGSDPVQLSYVNIKGKKARDAGMEFKLVQCPENSSTEDVIQQIAAIQAASNLAGLIIQLPLPEAVDKQAVLGAINQTVDVDCIGPANSQTFYADQGYLVPPTAGAIMEILDSLPVSLEGMRIVVVGQGELVGRPVLHLLEQRGFRPEAVDRDTPNTEAVLKEADVIISGTGQPGLVKGDMVKQGCIVIDAGTAESGGGIVGDVDFNSVSAKASYLSPVPGGVGPVTVAKLLENVLIAARNKIT